MNASAPAAVLAACAAASIPAAIGLRNLEEAGGRLADAVGRPRERVRRGAVARRLVARLGASRGADLLVSKERSAALAAAAGWPLGMDELAGIKVGGGLMGLLLGGVAPVMRPFLALLLAAACFRLPDFVAARAARARSKRASAEVPQLLDLLAAAATAGLSGPAALARAAGSIRGPLREELARAIANVELGRRWLDELSAVCQRLQLPDLRRATVVMARTETLGSSLADTLRDLADDVRERRRSALGEAARKAPVKMLFPLVLMILPAFLLLTVVPVLIATLRSLR
jgi:tight adherence protein C